MQFVAVILIAILMVKCTEVFSSKSNNADLLSKEIDEECFENKERLAQGYEDSFFMYGNLENYCSASPADINDIRSCMTVDSYMTSMQQNIPLVDAKISAFRACKGAALQADAVGAVEKWRPYVENIVRDMPKDSLSSMLIRASENKNTPVARILIKYGANVNVKNSNGYTPLMIAANDGNLHLVNLLILSKANLDEKNNYPGDMGGGTALMSAAYEGHSNIVKALLDAGASQSIKNNIGWTANTYAERGGNKGILEISSR